MSFLKKSNLVLVITPILLFSLGFITHLSTSPNLVQSQLIFFLLGITIFAVMSTVDYRLLTIVSKYIYWFVLASLILVLLLGDRVLGSTRWIDLGFFNFQPAEFAKFGIVLYIACRLADKEDTLKKIKSAALFALELFPILVLVLVEPDLGSAFIIFATVVAVLLVAGLDYWIFLAGFALFGLLSGPAWALLQEYQKHRLLAFLDPTTDALGKGYNVIQSVIAVGSGGFLGRGFGRGSQSHLNFLPVYWTDFVFAAFAEEWGFLGVLFLVILFVVLLLTLLFVAYRATDRLGLLIVVGVFGTLFSQFLINTGMNMGIMPVTGIPLPLISYGGSSLLTTAFLLGTAHSVWIHRKKL
jgi:rod shape determining protein RodA